MAEFDYIVVGAGMAGGVLANQLSARRGIRVLLIESANSPRPARTAENLAGYQRGGPADYDDLEKLGNPGWGWDTMAPIFDRLAQRELAVSAPAQPDPLAEDVIAAAVGLGWQRVEDPDESDADRIGYASTLRGFPRPAARRPNLTLATSSRADQVLIDQDKVVGVRTKHAGRTAVHRAGREVILAAGSLGSARILQLSGVGPAKVLRAAGVKVIADQPNVGRRMREQRAVVLRFELGDAPARRLPWHRHPAGPVLFGLFRTEPELDRPDARILIGRQGTELVCVGQLLRPDSAGSVAITDANPEAPLDVLHNYFGTAADRAASRLILRRMHELFAASPIAEHIVAETTPDHRAGEMVGTTAMGPRDDDVLDAQLRVRGLSGLRVVGAAALPFPVSGDLAGPVTGVSWRAAELLHI